MYFEVDFLFKIDLFISVKGKLKKSSSMVYIIFLILVLGAVFLIMAYNQFFHLTL